MVWINGWSLAKRISASARNKAKLCQDKANIAQRSSLNTCGRGKKHPIKSKRSPDLTWYDLENAKKERLNKCPEMSGKLQKQSPSASFGNSSSTEHRYQCRFGRKVLGNFQMSTRISRPNLFYPSSVQFSKEGYWGRSKRGRGEVTQQFNTIVQLCSTIEQLFRNYCEIVAPRNTVKQGKMRGNQSLWWELLRCLLWTIASLPVTPFTLTPIPLL